MDDIYIYIPTHVSIVYRDIYIHMYTHTHIYIYIHEFVLRMHACAHLR